MSSYIFRVKNEDARKALESLFLDERIPPENVLAALREIRGELEEYIAAMEDEIERRKTGTWQRDGEEG